MYRKDGFAVHLLVTCIGNGGFLCGFCGIYVIFFIFRDKMFANKISCCMFASLTDKHMKTSTTKCVICSQAFTGFGNNPYPVKKNGLCCQDCNFKFVIPQRISLIKK